MSKPIRTIGLLYPGEMGAALAEALRARGVRVVSTLAGRSHPTAARARGAGIEVLDSLADVARESSMVLSIVPPDAAEDVAASYYEVAHLAPPRALYVDANSISPERAESLAAALSRHRIDFVDAAINGLAKNLATGGTIFLSGRRAAEVAELLDGVARVCSLGEEPGRAKTMKMLLSGVSKGVCALFIELADLARRRELLPEFNDALSRIYPGIASLVERMLPTYANHAVRRAAEMNELHETAAAAGLQPLLIAAIREAHAALADSPGDVQCNVTAFIQETSV